MCTRAVTVTFTEKNPNKTTRSSTGAWTTWEQPQRQCPRRRSEYPQHLWHTELSRRRLQRQGRFPRAQSKAERKRALLRSAHACKACFRRARKYHPRHSGRWFLLQTEARNDKTGEEGVEYWPPGKLYFRHGGRQVTGFIS